MKPTNGTVRTTVITASIVLFLGFLGFTVHKIYIQDPECYAQKVDVSAFIAESRADRAGTKGLAIQNKEAVTEIRANFEWIKERQTELKEQNAGIQALQMKILERLPKNHD